MRNLIHPIRRANGRMFLYRLPTQLGNWLNTKGLGSNRPAILLQPVLSKQLANQKKDSFIHFSLDFTPYSVILTGMNKIEKIKKNIAFWQDKLNRSRKESLRSIRAVHLHHAQNELRKLEESA
jgi:hypothetical protein